MFWSKLYFDYSLKFFILFTFIRLISEIAAVHLHAICPIDEDLYNPHDIICMVPLTGLEELFCFKEINMLTQ